jgi:hypothetical protein
MVLSGGKYRATLGSFPDASAPPGGVFITWSVLAVDLAGNQRTVAVNKAERVKLVDQCLI